MILDLLRTGQLQDTLEYFKANLNSGHFEEIEALINHLTYYIASQNEDTTDSQEKDTIENLAKVFLNLKIYLEGRLADEARKINALDSKLYVEKGSLLFSIYNELKKIRSYLHFHILVLNFTINNISHEQYLSNFKMKSGVEGFEISRLLSLHYRNDWNLSLTRRLHDKLRAFYIELERTESWVRDILHETAGLHVNPKSIINSFKKNKISLFDEVQAVGLFMYLKKNKNILNYNQFDLARKIILWSTNGKSIDWKLNILNHFQIGDTKDCNLCKTLQNKAKLENEYKIRTVNIEINAQRKYLAALNEIKKNLGNTRWLIMQYPGYNFDFVQEEFENDKNINLFNMSPIIFPLLKDLNYKKVFVDRIGHLTGHFTDMSIQKINEKLYSKILNEMEMSLKNKKLRREKNGH